MFSKQCKLHLEEANMTRWEHFKHAMWVLQLEKQLMLVFYMHLPHVGLNYATDKCKQVLDKK